MPLFSWKGVDYSAHIHTGKTYAPSLQHLDELLLKRNIALCSAQKSRTLSFLPLSKSHGMQFLKFFTILLKGGLLIPHALSLAHDYASHPKLHDLIFALKTHIQEGFSLAESLSAYPNLFDNYTISMISAGEESGQLIEALTELSDYHDSYQAIKNQIRSSLWLPIITATCFLGILYGIIVGIVPRFITLYRSLRQDIPPTLSILNDIGHFFHSIYFMVLLAVLMIIALGAKKLLRIEWVRYYITEIFLYMPFVRLISLYSFNFYFFRSLSLLVRGGIPLPSACNRIQSTIKNPYFCKAIQEIEADISQGMSLVQALYASSRPLFSPELISFILIGQESGNLAGQLSFTAQYSKECLLTYINTVNRYIQPALLILLGLAVLFLIITIYMPIINLSYNII